MSLLEIEPEEPRMDRAPTLDVEPEPPAPIVEEPAATTPSQETALARQSRDLVTRAKLMLVTDPESFEIAGAFLQTLKDKQRQVEEFFEPDIQRAHAAWKGLTTKRASYVDPLKEAIGIVSTRYATFAREEKARAERAKRDEEERIRREEQERLRKEAEAREAEAKRLEDEALKATSREEGFALQQQAETAVAEAEQLKVDAATVQAPVLPLKPSVEPPKGVSVRSNWTFELQDFEALIKAVAAGQVSREALLPNESYLRSRARADKETCRIPGVRIYDAYSVAHRRSR